MSGINQMNKFKNFISIFVFFVLMTLVVNAQTENKNFTGSWSLNRTKTNIKDLPKELKNYRLVVNQADNKINIKNFIDG